MRPVPSLAEYPRYEETQLLMQYTKQVGQTNMVNKTKSVSGWAGEIVKINQYYNKAENQ